MAVINFTQADKLSSLLAETGWYPLEIMEIDGPKASSSGKSVTFYATLKVVSGPLEGKQFTIAYNTGTKSLSILNGMQYEPHTGLIALYAAAFNLDRNAVPDGFDTDLLLHKQVDGKVEKGIHDGVPGNSIIAVLPLGQGQNQKVPF